MLTAIVLAAGQSRRMGGGEDKTLMQVAGHPLLYHSLALLSSLAEVSHMVLVGAADRLDVLAKLVEQYGFNKVRAIVAGGCSRQQSVQRGLKALSWPCDYVLVHDGARPCLARQDARRVIAHAKTFGAAILAVPMTDTVKRVEAGRVADELDRNKLWAVQTPQVFKKQWLEAGHAHACRLKVAVTDDAALVSALGYKVQVTEGSPLNIKITRPHDLQVAELYLKGADG